MTPELRATLQDVAEAMVSFPRDWWIIGSAGVALHGIEAGTVKDVDLLVEEGLAGAVLDRLGIVPLDMSPDPLFRSTVFARWMVPPVPVEVMAGFCVAEANVWHPVKPRSRERVMLGGGALFVPDRAELLGLFRRFGRPKDAARAAALEAAGAPPEAGTPAR
ncbi:hypothetical protein [Sphingomonas sp. GM_Shp_1]|uniref:hypothetical protein n=1 Tax=Sphingomonas sp. GM_Shp_1 TaxID=2937381 RepID=UPI00226B61E4|nr:hypothetical protein [Sphingomonas sp. GM_Shp_1]